MLPLARAFVVSLLFCLSVTAFAGSAAAWRIEARLERQNDSQSGPSDSEDASSGPGDKVVSVDQTDPAPPSSQISGQASVDLMTGTLHGRAYAYSYDRFAPFEAIRFVSVLEEEVHIIFPSVLPVADRIVRVRATISGEPSHLGAGGHALGLFGIDVNGQRGSVEFVSSDFPGLDQGWTVLEQGTGVTATRIGSPLELAGTYEFLIALPNGTEDLFIGAQLEGYASGRGTDLVGPSWGDVNALQGAYLELLLPEGATFTSGSGVFLIPEPGSGALVLAGACILAARGRRGRSLA